MHHVWLQQLPGFRKFEAVFSAAHIDRHGGPAQRLAEVAAVGLQLGLAAERI
jgi:hypothetical protein